MTSQEMFDRVVTHLREQNQPATKERGKEGSCYYRLPRRGKKL